MKLTRAQAQVGPGVDTPLAALSVIAAIIPCDAKFHSANVSLSSPTIFSAVWLVNGYKKAL